jgi:hypothetical protein
MALEHDYQVSPAELFAVLIDPTYLEARSERFGGVDAPTVETDDDTTTVTTWRQLPMDKIPAAFKSFVGDGRIEQVDTWEPPGDDEPVHADWRATVGTAPATINGEHVIEATDDGCRYTITTNVKVKIPFFGGKVEEQIEGYLEYLIGKEQAYVAEWIAEQ